MIHMVCSPIKFVFLLLGHKPDGSVPVYETSRYAPLSIMLLAAFLYKFPVSGVASRGFSLMVNMRIFQASASRTLIDDQ